MEERIQLTAKSLIALKVLAAKRGVTIQRAIEDCISTEVYMDDQLAKGRRVLVQDDDEISICTECGYSGSAVYKVVFTHMKRNSSDE